MIFQERDFQDRDFQDRVGRAGQDSAMTALPKPPLLAITDRSQAVRPLPELAAALFARGLRWLSLREKDLPGPEQVALARALVAAAHPWGAAVTVHGDPEVARAAGAAGVHLADGGDAAAARRRLGPGALIGLSVHGAGGLRRAAEAGADYVTVSPVFASASKPGYGPVLGIEGLRRSVAESPLPVLALGGVEGEGVSACLAAGAAGVAVMGPAMREPDALPGLLARFAGRTG